MKHVIQKPFVVVYYVSNTTAKRNGDMLIVWTVKMKLLKTKVTHMDIKAFTAYPEVKINT